MAQEAVARTSRPIQLACAAFRISPVCYRHPPRRATENDAIADHVIRLTHSQRNRGVGLCFLHPRNLKGHPWHHQRVYRSCRALELNLRIQPKKRIVREKPEPLAVPEAINDTWPMDCMHDALPDGRGFRRFNVLDDYIS